MKKAFTLVEIIIVFMLILLTAYLVIPSLVEDTKQIENIAKWKYSYHNIEYIFSGIVAQFSEEDKIRFKKAKNNTQKEKVLFDLINPYLRVESKVDPQKYKLAFLNGSKVTSDDYYYFENLYATTTEHIVGLKWLNTPASLSESSPMAILLFDTNGLKAPNKWGFDVFGVNIYLKKIEPFGKEIQDDKLLEQDCSNKGKGVYCSYYFYTYGGYIQQD